MNKKAMFVSPSIFFSYIDFILKGRKDDTKKVEEKKTKLKKRKCKRIKNIRKLRNYLAMILSNAFNLKSIFEKKKCSKKFMEYF